VVATVKTPSSANYAMAITPDGHRAYVTDRNNTVSVINTATNTVVATVKVSGPYNVAFTPDGTRAYVTRPFVNRVTVIATATNTVIAEIISPSRPFGIAITPDGTHAYVPHSSSKDVSVIATATNAVIATIPLGAFASSYFPIAITPDGTRAYVVTPSGGDTMVIDTTPGSSTYHTVIARIRGVWGDAVAITPDGRRAYVLSPVTSKVVVIDITPGSLTYHSIIATVPRKGNDVAITPTDSACTNLWKIQWFRCDFGHDNSFVLQRDGTPVCGSGNCAAPPNGCWSTPIVAQRYDRPGNGSWAIGSLGELRVGYDRDVQVYGETFLLVRSPQSLMAPLAADVGRVWLNNTDVTGSGPAGAVTLNLNAGWNHLEWTAYNQHQGAGLEMNFPFASYVKEMACEPSDGSTASLGTLVATSRLGRPWVGSCGDRGCIEAAQELRLSIQSPKKWHKRRPERSR
jgi:YVTN family beta-propeller protein